MKDGLRGLKNEPAPPQPCRSQESHSHAQKWLETATGVAAVLAGHGKMP